MATFKQAFSNVRKHGIVPTLVGSIKQPGGFLGAQSTTGISPNMFRSTSYLRPATTANAAPPDAPIPDPDTTIGLNQFTGGGTGSGTGGPQYVQLPDGRVFDVNDPAQRQAYFVAYNDLLDQQIGSQFNLFRTQQELANQDAVRDYARALGLNQQETEELQRQVEEYNFATERQVTDANEAYGLGTARRQNLFAQASPLAYQSSQGTSQQFAQGQLTEGLADIDRAREQTQRQATQQEAQLAQQRGDIESGYNRFTQQATQGIDDYLRQLQEAYAPRRTELAGDLSAIDVGQGINRFRYDRPQTQGFQGQFADLSQRQPFLSFNQVASSPEANYFRSFSPKISNKLKPVEQFLGYDPRRLPA